MLKILLLRIARPAATSAVPCTTDIPDQARRVIKSYLTLLAALIPLTFASVVHAQAIEGLGFRSSNIYLSHDGKTLVADLGGPSNDFVLWKQGQGLRYVHENAVVFGISGDGRVVLGYQGVDAFAWTEEGGLRRLRSQGAVATGASYDGSVIVGNGCTENLTGGNDEEECGALMWLGTGAPTRLWYGFGGRDGFAWTDSAGTVVVGTRRVGPHDHHDDFYAWPSGNTAFTDVPHVAIRGLSADGKVAIGYANGLPANVSPGHRWEIGSEPVPIGLFPQAMNGDGSVIFGSLSVWIRDEGIRPLTEWLEENGVDIGEWQLTHVLGASVDGRVLVGVGYNAEGLSEAWRVVLASCLVVTDLSDEPDADPGDGVCDTSDSEDGHQCTLRAAIEEANALDGRQCITFDVRDASGGLLSEIPIIRPASLLPTITDSLTIDGTTQEGGFVEIDGSSAGAGSGLAVEADSFSVRGLLVNRFAEYGLRLTGGAGHVIQENRIGFDADGEELRLNELGGILVEGGATRVLIGSEEEGDDENYIGGGVIVQGEDTRGVSVLRNVLEVKEEWLSSEVIGVPIDLDGDGPTCTTWDEQSRQAPNDYMPPPRILSIDDRRVEGMTRPGAKVVVFRAATTGTERGRYWARRTEAIAVTEADADGYFAVDHAADVGDTLAFSATDADGNTSEISQIRRPVIFAPGIGGSVIKAADGTSLWLPLGLGPNDRLARLALDQDGLSIETANVDGVLESVLGLRMVYGPGLDHLESEGFPGHERNDNDLAIDLWRFSNDWRLSTYDLSEELKELVDRLTGGGSDVASSCEVDLVAHSNGGLIASVYLKRYTEAPDRVNRFITLGTPYLGTPQAAAAHTRGYVFDLEKNLTFRVDWGRMIEMSRNLTGAYGLMPSNAYWEATAASTSNGQPGHYLVDLFNEPLKDHEETFAFLVAPKLTPDQTPLGLGRNASIWMKQQSQVHDLVDDWSNWNGPTNIFRIVGALQARTATAWELGPGRDLLAAGQTRRSEPGDTDRHRAYRERLTPIRGWGDKTVALTSATLGRQSGIGAKDFSGVDDSRFIHDFEPFPCEHGDLVATKCERTSDGLKSLDLLVRYLKSSSEVLAPAGAAQKHDAEDDAPPESFYVFADGPVAFWAEDEAGARTGPLPDDEYDVTAFDLDEVSYFASDLTATIAFSSELPYALTAMATREPVTVRAVQIRYDEDGPTEHLIYPAASLAAGGSMTMSPEARRTGRWDLDEDGDGIVDREIGPVVTAATTQAAPALPLLRPWGIARELNPEWAEDEVVEIKVINAGEVAWQWEIEASEDWIRPVATEGVLPAMPSLELTMTSISSGKHEGMATVRLSVEEESLVYQVPVSVNVIVGLEAQDEASDQLPGSFTLSQNYPNPFNPSTTIRYALPQASTVRLAVYDVLGRTVAVPVDGSQAAGWHEVAFDAQDLPSGVYVYRIEAGTFSESRKMVLMR